MLLRGKFAFPYVRAGFCQNRQDHDTYLQIEVYRLQGAGGPGEEDGEDRLVGQAKLAIYPRGGEDSPRKEYRQEKWGVRAGDLNLKHN